MRKKISLNVYIVLFLISILMIILTCTTPTSSSKKTKHKKKDNPTPIIYSWIGTKLLGVSGASTGARDIAVDLIGNVYASGYTNGNLDGQALTGTSDLFVVKYNSNGIKLWTRLLGVPGADTNVDAITSDLSGNIYITGYTDGNLDGQTLTGTEDLFVVKYDTNGVKQWTRLLGVPGADTEAEGIDVDSNGNLYIGGYTEGNLDGQTLTGDEDLFVVKYDTNGVKQWTRLLGVPGGMLETEAYNITVDLNGNAYASGYTTGNLDGQTLSGIADLFVVKYDTNGVKQWTRLLGSSGAETLAYGITADSNGNIYACGFSDGNLDGQILTGTLDLLVVKYDTNGVKQWTRLLGCSGAHAYASDIVTDLYGNVYTTGFTNGNLDGQILTGREDLLVVKYDTNGVKQWTRLLGVSGVDTWADGIATDIIGNVYTTGRTTGNLDGQILTGTSDLFIVKYNSIGIK